MPSQWGGVDILSGKQSLKNFLQKFGLQIAIESRLVNQPGLFINNTHQRLLKRA